MTEYDYSPDAYERYLATQQRIARWVDNTNQYPPSNPFVLSPSIDPRTARDLPPVNSSPSRTNSRTSNSYYSKSRSRSSSDATYNRPDPPFRSQTAPTPVQRSSVEHSRPPSSRHTSSSSRSRSTQHSSSRSISSRHTNGSTLTRTSTSTYRTVTPNRDSPTYIKASDTEPILVPIDGGRGGYVIVPPRGKRMEVLVSSYLFILLVLSWWITSDV